MTVEFITKDPCTDIILDFIAGNVPGNPSGESIGNYNAVIGNSHASDILARKTLSQIYALMSTLLAKGMPSTAVGRYQIIRDTMRILQAKKGISDNALFTPALQDNFALALLVGRGYPAWWTGRLTDEEFAHNISCEWASLPDPNNGGKSHYDNIGQNHAGTTLAIVYAMLGNARAAQKRPIPTPPDTPSDAPLTLVDRIRSWFGV